MNYGEYGEYEYGFNAGLENCIDSHSDNTQRECICESASTCSNVFDKTDERNDCDYSTCENLNSNSNSKVFRYKLSDDFANSLYIFSKIHQYDDRKTFKDAWNLWIEDNSGILNIEIERLKNKDYEGDVLDKIFKSARYYFRKKSTSDKKPRKRRDYIPLRKELLNAMDEHIVRHVNEEDYRPSSGFVDFCKTQMELLRNEINVLSMNDPVIIKEKFKKTYKNRYFMLTTKET